MQVRSSYTKQLRALNETILELSDQISADIMRTGSDFENGELELVQEVVDEHRKHERELKRVEDNCMSIMLLQQPMASDLRLVTAAFRAISDLSRIHEMSYETALLMQEAKLIEAKELAKPLANMAGLAAKMVEDAAKSFALSDVALAGGVFPQDSAVDELFVKIRERIVAELKTGSETALIAPELLTVAKYYERTGDHAQSIADWALFRATGVYRGRSMGEADV